MKNWGKVKLGSLLTESKVVSEIPNTDKRISVRLNVQGVEKRPIAKDKKGATKYYIRKAGQFIYGKQNLHKGAFGIVPKELDGFESSLDIPAFDVNDSCYPEWIYYFFLKGNFYLKLEGIAKGVGSKRIHPKQIFGLDIYLPTKEEQKRIIEEIKNAEANNQELVKEIQFQEDHLIKLRKSILQDAVQGKLTKDWRKQNLTIGSAKELLKIIKAEKEQLTRKKIIRKEIPLAPIAKEETTFEIPASWEWCRLGDVVLLKSGQDLKPNEYSDTEEVGIPYITGASNLQNGKIVINRWTIVPKSIANKGDLLLTCKGSGVGKMGWLEEESAHIARQIMAIRTLKISINYVKIILDIKASDFKSNATGLIPGIDRKTVLKTIVPLPPIEEQEEIISKLNLMQSDLNILEHHIISSKDNSIKVIDSVIIELLGSENNVLVSNQSVKEVNETFSREIKYNSKTLHMDLVKLLNENGKLHAEDLWKMSIYPDDIDAFYAELKEQVEQKKTIKESKEKGYLELS